ncbi:MAG: DUF58 domain-containing protein [Gammaproteobacteria bacterium]
MRPTPRALWLVAGWTLIGLLLALNNWLPSSLARPDWQPTLVQLWQIATAALVFLLLLDAFTVRYRQPIQVAREHHDSLALGAWSPVTLRLTHSFTRPVSISVFDHIPAGADADFPQQQGQLRPGQGTEFRYRLRLPQRGNHQFGLLDVLLTSHMGLWQRRIFCGESTALKVYPNYAAVSQYAMLAMEQQSGQLGIRKQQRRGEGMDFHQLREFRQGDSLRQIDWNATARQRKLISKEYQDEKDQQILFLVDCGRRMRSHDGELSHLDHALNAMLLMSYAALKQGDAVGMMSFGGEERWLKPVKGVANISHLLNLSYDLKATTRASDYSTAVRHLLTHHNKRALIVVLTDIQDENTDDLLPALRLLQGKHLVMLANLEEPALHDVLLTPVQQFEAALRYAGTLGYLEQRRQVTQQLNRQGIMTVNCVPAQLPIQLVNKYFEIKRKGVL